LLGLAPYEFSSSILSTQLKFHNLVKMLRQFGEVLNFGLSRMFGLRLPDHVSLVCLLVRAQHTMVFKYAWLPHTLPLPCLWIELPLYTRTRLILTFVVCPDGQRWLYVR
jgi:hypothetical protein